MKTADLCRKHGISEGCFYNWKDKYGGLEVSEAKRLKGLESENARLKKLLADVQLAHELVGLRDVIAHDLIGSASVMMARRCPVGSGCTRSWQPPVSGPLHTIWR
jgi:putative transposase